MKHIFSESLIVELFIKTSILTSDIHTKLLIGHSKEGVKSDHHRLGD